MRPNQPRQQCDCGLIFRYPSDFEEHKRVGCIVESGKGDSLSPEPDEAPAEGVIPEPAPEAPVAEKPKKQRRKK